MLRFLGKWTPTLVGLLFIYSGGFKLLHPGEAPWRRTVRSGERVHVYVDVSGSMDGVKGALDRAFLARYCTGFEALEDYILGRSDGIAKSPAWAAPITGIDESRIAGLARRLTGRRS